MGLFRKLSGLIVVAFAMALLPAGPTAANRILGSLQGVFSGNDSEAQILADLGLNVTQLARVEADTDLMGNPPTGSAEGLTISNISFNDDMPPEPIAGWWDYAGSMGTVDLLVVKAGNQFAAYLYTDALTMNMPNLGLWDTSDLSNKGVSHISAYNIPEPATLALLSSGLIGLVAQGRRRTTL